MSSKAQKTQEVEVQEMIGDVAVHERVDDIPVHYTCRRYPSRTYTWADIHIHGHWYSLGEPWPAASWKREALIFAIRETVLRVNRVESNQN